MNEVRKKKVKKSKKKKKEEKKEMHEKVSCEKDFHSWRQLLEAWLALTIGLEVSRTMRFHGS